MAVTASGLYYNTFLRALTNAAAIDLSAETYKGALFNNSITPNFDTDTYYGVAPYNANEVTTVTYWPAGGVALIGTTFSVATGTLKFAATDGLGHLDDPGQRPVLPVALHGRHRGGRGPGQLRRGLLDEQRHVRDHLGSRWPVYPRFDALGG